MNQSIIKLLGITLIVTSINLLTTRSQADETQPTVPRPKPSFFEQERKPRFGFGDFVNSALDGVDNFLDADNNVKTLLANKNPFYDPTKSGTLTIYSRDKNSNTFLDSILTSSSGTTILQLGPAHPSGDPRIGTIDVISSTITSGVTSFNYSGSFSVKGSNLVSGAIELFNPKNPSQSIFIQLPARNIPNVSNNSNRISAPVSFSVGLPIDR